MVLQIKRNVKCQLLQILELAFVLQCLAPFETVSSVAGRRERPFRKFRVSTLYSKSSDGGASVVGVGWSWWRRWWGRERHSPSRLTHGMRPI